MNNEVKFNSAILNNIEGLIVTTIKESILPPLSTIRKSIPGKRGSKYIRKEIQEKKIEVGIELMVNSFSERETLVNQLTPVLFTEQEEELIIRNNKKYKASLNDNTDLENLVHDGVTILTFIATDPIAYGDTKIIDIIANPTNNNAGTYKTKGTITIDITEAVDHIQVTLQDTGEYIYLEHDFVVGDLVLIDLEGEMAYKNGYSIMADCYLESDFFEIPTGEFEMTVSTGKATLEFIERWL